MCVIKPVRVWALAWDEWLISKDGQYKIYPTEMLAKKNKIIDCGRIIQVEIKEVSAEG